MPDDCSREIAEILTVLIPDTDDTDRLIHRIEGKRRMLWLEGWADPCLEGTGFPPMEEGSFEEKQQYIEDITPRQMEKVAAEREMKMVCSGFVPLDDKDFLYGVSWAVFEEK